MNTPLWHRWLSRLPQITRSSRRPIARKPQRLALRLDQLEDRLVPSTIVENTASERVDLPASGTGFLSGVISDPTDPGSSIGIDFTIDDPGTLAALLSVSAVSSNTNVVPNNPANLTFSGLGAARNLKITPTGKGFTNITVTVSGGSEADATYVIQYAASDASTTPTLTHYHTGSSDASGAVAIDSNFMFVADDEDEKIRFYDRNNSGLMEKNATLTQGFLDVHGLLGLSENKEVDIEGAARVGNHIFWVASESNSKEGNPKPNRNRIFVTDISGTGADTSLAFVGHYDHLKDDLLAWDAAGTHGLGKNALDFATGVNGLIPERVDGYNIEGMAFKPGDPSTAYIAFRAPLESKVTRDRALIVPVTNFDSLASGNGAAGSAHFGAPIFLNLGGRGIRDIASNGTDLLIVAGPATADGTFALYTWTGNANDVPVRHTADLTAMHVEAIPEVPALLDASTQLQLISDNGDEKFYDNTPAKDLRDEWTKFRSDTVTLGASAPAASDGGLIVLKDVAKSGTLVAHDPDSPNLTYSIVSQADAHGTVTITDSATGAFTYTPTAGFTGSASFTFKASDGTLDSDPGRIIITVVTPGSVNEDDRNPAGSTIGSLVDAYITDADAGALKGAAIVGVGQASQGTWQYSTTGGKVWINLGDVGLDHARLLRSTDKIRFLPAGNFAGQVAFQFRAWDQTAGTAGSIFNTEANGYAGGGGPFSTAVKPGFFVVKPVNDRPVLDAGGSPFLDPVQPDAADPTGMTVERLLGSLVTDTDQNALRGAAITGAVSSAKTGKWQIQLSAGAGWVDLGVVSPGKALLLTADTPIRFLPAAGFAGTVTISYRAWDQTSGIVATRGPIPAASTAFSLATETASLQVTATPPTPNHAPVLDNSGSPTFLEVVEDNSKSPGNTVAELLTNSVTDADANPLSGIAVTGLTGTANGTWMYSTNKGLAWIAIGVVAEDNALLLRSTDKIHFVPALNFNGDVSITYHAWDRTSGGVGGHANIALVGAGGQSAFSVAVEQAFLLVTPVNDRPVLNIALAPFLTSVPVGAPDPAGNSIFELLGASVTDPDGDTSPGIVVTAAASSMKTGKWQYQPNNLGGGGWLDVGAVTPAKGLLLQADGKIRFLPAAGFTGTVSLSYRAWDRNPGSGDSGDKVAISPISTVFSLATETATLTVNNVNDRPVLNSSVIRAVPPAAPTDTNPPGAQVFGLVHDLIRDIDPSDTLGIAIVGASTTGGHWETSPDGTTWTSVGAVTPKSALLLTGLNNLIRFLPDGTFVGKATLSYRAWDGTSGANGDRIDVTPKTATAFSLTTGTILALINHAPELSA